MSFVTGLPSPPTTPKPMPTPRIILHLSPRSNETDASNQPRTSPIRVVTTGRSNPSGVHKKRRSATRSQRGSRDSGSSSSSGGRSKSLGHNPKRTRARKVSRTGNGLTTGIGMSIPISNGAQASAATTATASELPAQRPRIVFRMGPRPPRIILHVNSRGHTGTGSALVRPMTMPAGVGVRERAA